MSIDKQIEEMAVELGVYACKKTPCKDCAVDYDCIWLEQATRLYNAGYRNASEVAREIIADLEKIIEVDKYGEAKFDVRELYEIEKKYTEGGK